MILRVAWEGDRPQLTEFVCCDGSKGWELEVQEWIQTEAWDWFEAGVDDPRLLLFIDEFTNELAAVAAHEQGLNEHLRFVNAIAVQSDSQGSGLGLQVMVSVLADAASRCPDGGAYWSVHPENHRSCRLSDRIEADCTSPPDDAPYLRYAITLAHTWG